MSGRSRHGSVLVEFVLAGIPILFTIVSVVEISRCMWTYNTLEHAVTEATRMAVVHGADCVAFGNSCSIRVHDIAQRIADSSQGLSPDRMTVTLTGGGAGGSLSSYLGNYSDWPAYPAGTTIAITAVYPFDSPMAIFFPGLGAPTSWVTINLTASSREPVQF